MNLLKVPQNFISQLILSCWMKLIIGATAFLITYTTTAPLIGAVNKTDIQNQEKR